MMSLLNKPQNEGEREEMLAAVKETADILFTCADLNKIPTDLFINGCLHCLFAMTMTICKTKKHYTSEWKEILAGALLQWDCNEALRSKRHEIMDEIVETDE